MAHLQLSSRSTSRHRLSAACDEFARLPSPQGAGQVPAQPTRGVESRESHSRARRCAERSGWEKSRFFCPYSVLFVLSSRRARQNAAGTENRTQKCSDTAENELTRVLLKVYNVHLMLCECITQSFIIFPFPHCKTDQSFSCSSGGVSLSALPYEQKLSQHNKASCNDIYSCEMSTSACLDNTKMKT